MENQSDNEHTLLQKLEYQEEKLDKIYKSVESTRKMFLITIIISVLTVVLPIIGMAIFLPMIFNSLSSIAIPKI
jgi:type IV secretory pathway component VirB8